MSRRQDLIHMFTRPKLLGGNHTPRTRRSDVTIGARRAQVGVVASVSRSKDAPRLDPRCNARQRGNSRLPGIGSGACYPESIIRELAAGAAGERPDEPQT